MALPKKNRLKGRREFSKVFSGARPTTTEYFSLRITRDTADKGQRFAVIVPAKIVALASARNALRRRVSEVVRRIIRESPVTPGARVILTVRSPSLPDVATLKRELLSLMNKSGILHT